MSPLVFAESLSDLLKFAKIINANETLTGLLDQDSKKSLRKIPHEYFTKTKEFEMKENIIAVIEDKVLLPAVNCEYLEPEIKISIDRTTLRLHSMRVVEEIASFFNNTMRSERGIIVQKSLREQGLLTFEDIKDEINEIYNSRYK
jgi:hypothetical protein